MRTAALIAIAFLAGVVVGGRPSTPAGSAAVAAEWRTTIRVLPTEPAVLPPTAPRSSVACDPAAQQFAAMFGFLSEQALANAAIDQSTLDGALASDRATFRRYLDALGIAVDGPQLDALLAGFPAASGSPFDVGDC
jgi:hypothetical protein